MCVCVRDKSNKKRFVHVGANIVCTGYRVARCEINDYANVMRHFLLYLAVTAWTVHRAESMNIKDSFYNTEHKK